ncbi:MAG: methyltransferase domain-containing protein [Candidatus Krumholzibacteriota bacterium]|nr:methyltransferase domain-containing protein [Candidatus Krumholzibacteriota bacterium]
MSPKFRKCTSVQLTVRYDAEARTYGDCWTPVLHPMSCRLVWEFPDDPVERVLDLGAGTGSLLPVLREKFSGAVVIGADRSRGMLERAGSQSPLAAMDACSSGFRDGAFDVTVMAFVLFHLPDPVVGLSEARRVLCPGGKLGLTTWANDAASRAAEIWDEELIAHGAIAPEEVARIAQHDLMDSTEKVEGLLAAAGFVSTRAEIHEFTHRIQLDDFIRLKTGVGSSAQRLESIGPGNEQKFLASARQRLSALSAADFTMQMSIVFAFANAPG